MKANRGVGRYNANDEAHEGQNHVIKDDPEAVPGVHGCDRLDLRDKKSIVSRWRR